MSGARKSSAALTRIGRISFPWKSVWLAIRAFGTSLAEGGMERQSRPQRFSPNKIKFRMEDAWKFWTLGTFFLSESWNHFGIVREGMRGMPTLKVEDFSGENKWKPSMPQFVKEARLEWTFLCSGEKLLVIGFALCSSLCIFVLYISFLVSNEGTKARHVLARVLI